MQTQIVTKTQAEIDEIDAFCNDLDVYMETGIMSWQVLTYKGVETFKVSNPTIVYFHAIGEAKVECLVVDTPVGFEHMKGQIHRLSLL